MWSLSTRFNNVLDIHFFLRCISRLLSCCFQLSYNSTKQITFCFFFISFLFALYFPCSTNSDLLARNLFDFYCTRHWGICYFLLFMCVCVVIICKNQMCENVSFFSFRTIDEMHCLPIRYLNSHYKICSNKNSCSVLMLLLLLLTEIFYSFFSCILYIYLMLQLPILFVSINVVLLHSQLNVTQSKILNVNSVHSMQHTHTHTQPVFNQAKNHSISRGRRERWWWRWWW